MHYMWTRVLFATAMHEIKYPSCVLALSVLYSIDKNL